MSTWREEGKGQAHTTNEGSRRIGCPEQTPQSLEDGFRTLAPLSSDWPEGTPKATRRLPQSRNERDDTRTREKFRMGGTDERTATGEPGRATRRAGVYVVRLHSPPYKLFCGWARCRARERPGSGPRWTAMAAPRAPWAMEICFPRKRKRRQADVSESIGEKHRCPPLACKIERLHLYVLVLFPAERGRGQRTAGSGRGQRSMVTRMRR